MTTDLEARLRTQLRDDAGRISPAVPEWPGQTYVAAPRPRSAARVLVAAALVAVVGGAGTLAVLRHRDGTHDGTSSAAAPPPAFVVGTEYAVAEFASDRRPIGDVSAVATAPDLVAGLVKPGSIHHVRLPDSSSTVLLFDSAFAGPMAARTRCATVSGHEADETCFGADPYGMLVGVRSVGPDGRPAPGADGLPDDRPALTMWGPLPSGTAVVQFTDPDGVQRWQRPVAGTAVFPTGGRPDVYDPTATSRVSSLPVVSMQAFDAAGNTLADSRTNDYTPFLTGEDPTGARWRDDLRPLAAHLLSACLVGGGAAIAPDAPRFPTFAAGIDADAVWNSCVDSTTAAVRQREIDTRG